TMLHCRRVVKKAERTPATFAADCLAGLRRAEALRPRIINEAPRTVDEGLTLYNELLTAASASNALAGLMSEVHPDEAIRDAARECEQEVSRFYSDLALDREMYDALAAIDVSSSDADTQRFHAHTLRDYRRAGVDKSPEVRARLKQIDEELTRLGQQFSKNISEDVRVIELDAAAAHRLAGLPADFIAAHPPENGKIRITTDYPDYNPFMTYADDDDLRKQLYIAFRSRGESLNEQVLHDILKLRSEKSSLLGFQNWADYVTADKMIGSGDRAAEFIEKVWRLAQPRAEQDYKELLAQLQQVDRKANHVADWQKVWLENRVKKTRYEVDSSEVRQYFPYERVLAGLLEITSEIFDLRYVPIPEPALRWHASVLVYDVVRGADEKLGRIYLDMHPRDGKYKHAAQFPLKDGVRGVQLPEGVLVCNFSAPGESGAPALMEHDDVVTMFHEFGHLMHHVLGGHQRWITQSGVATEWDFVEAPSQMFEEWAWSYDTLARFARHHETGEVIPPSLVDNMRRADKFGLGTATVQQIFYASISLNFHRADPDTLDQLAEVQRLQKHYTPFAYVPGTRFHASFGHLVGYSAMYYTYQWSLVIAKDLLTPFQEHGLMAKDVTFAYRDKVLAPGGSRDAAELVRDFLGRDYDFQAYEQFLVA
ncbi:MAG TPA: M3 family metallopeptidase, partial [Kofleriaceae bacterium]|nr:M3 family metallopeptidase [Kofleriaceae bacterium]